MFVADTFVNIREYERQPEVNESMVEEFDRMLNEYNVKHFFSLPLESTDGIADDPTCFLSISYNSEDDLTFKLVYMLWAKTVRGISEDRIWSAMYKSSCKRGKKPAIEMGG